MIILKRLFPYLWILCLMLACTSSDKRTYKVFRYNESAGIGSLDPAFARNQAVMWATGQLYNTLVEVDSNLHIRPSLAKHWEIEEEGRTLIFHLRTDVYFHDDACFMETSGKGRRMVAEDVVYSFNRLINPETASPGAWIFNERVHKNLPFEAVNDSTFRLRLNEPFVPILGVLSMKYCSVIAREAVDKYGVDFRKHPVGTGPFRLLVWKEGQALVLQKNPNYFERDSMGNQLPYLDGIKVTFLENKATEFVLFRQGSVDFINDVDPSFKDELLTRQGKLKANWSGKVRLHKSPYLSIEYLGMLQQGGDTLFRNVNFRKALNYAIDKRRMLMYLRNGVGVPADEGFIPPGLPSFLDNGKGYTYNLDSVKVYLNKAG
jgi:peptide/nickel transport system substrate-binding protein